MKYKIAYHYRMMGEIEIEADSLEEAKDLASDLSADNPQNEYYVDASFQINEEVTDELNK